MVQCLKGYVFNIAPLSKNIQIETSGMEMLLIHLLFDS